jgi:peptide/nickel transport system ATP-binding protein
VAGAEPRLVVEGLEIGFGRLAAVRGIDFSLAPGECLAIVGESGSGKSVTARALLGLVGAGSSVRARRITLDGLDLNRPGRRGWRTVRGARIGLVTQDALVSLDPARRVGAEIGEALRNHDVVPRSAVWQRVCALLATVRMPEPEERARQYPHELSGGQRQRALIASAIAAGPGVLVADEPTTALDVAAQAKILDLLAGQKAAGQAILLVSHDLSVVARLADRIAVMFAGRIVEDGPAESLLRQPVHPYTRALLAAVPVAHARGTRLAAPESGRPVDPETACGYAARCPLATDRCRVEVPVPVGGVHRAWCWHTDLPWPGGSRESPVPARESPVPARESPGQVPIIEVDAVSKRFDTRQAVDGVSFTLHRGETVGVLGESGSGKTTLARLLMGLLEPDTGQIRLHGVAWSGQPESHRRPLRRRIQLVPQDPLSSFDPRYPVARIIGEAAGRTGRRDRVPELLELVGLTPDLLGRRAVQLSGGQRQRVAIARALAPEPDVLVCDEPVSALDVSVQAQILDLFADVRDRLGVALVFVSHDLGVLHHVSDRVLVLRAGRIVETGPVEEIFAAPRDPYTRELLAALPRPTAVSSTNQ